MRKKILILTNSKDGKHTDHVIAKLTEEGEEVFRLNVDALSRGEIEVVFQADGSRTDFAFTSSDKTENIERREIKSVWYRRPNVFAFPIRDPAQKRFAKGELRHFLEGLWLSLNDVYWLNSPAHC